MSSTILVILWRADRQSSWLLVEDFIHMFWEGHGRSSSFQVQRSIHRRKIFIHESRDLAKKLLHGMDHHFEFEVMFQIILKDFIHVSCDSVKESQTEFVIVITTLHPSTFVKVLQTEFIIASAYFHSILEVIIHPIWGYRYVNLVDIIHHCKSVFPIQSRGLHPEIL